MQSKVDISQCPGFCGRVPENNSIGWSECAPCAWGSRTHNYQCLECGIPLPAYDWCYLLFMLVVPLLINSFYIHYYSSKRTTRIQECVEVLCATIECMSAAISTILCFPPRGFLTLNSCRKSEIKEWYPALYNPVIDYVKQIKCSYEIVFPLYSMPFIFLLFLLVFMLVYRSFLYSYVLKENHDARALYYGLLALPKVALGHGVLAGVIFNSFPYLLITFSVCSNALHLAMEGKAPIKEVIRRIYKSPTQLALLSLNMALLAFAIISLTAASNSYIGLFFLLLVPVPALFYILTVRLTHPSVLNDV